MSRGIVCTGAALNCQAKKHNKRENNAKPTEKNVCNHVTAKGFVTLWILHLPPHLHPLDPQQCPDSSNSYLQSQQPRAFLAFSMQPAWQQKKESAYPHDVLALAEVGEDMDHVVGEAPVATVGEFLEHSMGPYGPRFSLILVGFY